MARKRKWQRGSADLVSVACGLTILAIVTAGTSAAMVYGREALVREEHYKAAAYALRGVMEEVQGELIYVDRARESQYLGPRLFPDVPLDRVDDHSGINRPVICHLSRDMVQQVYLPETGESLDYYIVTCRANWVERDYAEDARGGSGERREIVFTTAIFPSSIY